MASPSSSTNLSLNKWYTTDPWREGLRNGCYNAAWTTASLVTLAAGAALASSVVTLSFFVASGATIPTGITILGSVALIASGRVIQKAITLWHKSGQYAIQAKNEFEIDSLRVELAKKYLDKDGVLNIEKINNDPTFKTFGIQVTEEMLTNIQKNLPMPTKLEERIANIQEWALSWFVDPIVEKPNKRASQAYLQATAKFFHCREGVRRADEKLIKEETHNHKSLPAETDSKEKWDEYWTKRNEHLAKQHDYRETWLLLYTLHTAFFLAILKNPFESASSLDHLGDVQIKGGMLRQENHLNYFVFKNANVKPIETTGLLTEAAKECLFADSELQRFILEKPELETLASLLFNPEPQTT